MHDNKEQLLGTVNNTVNWNTVVTSNLRSGWAGVLSIPKYNCPVHGVKEGITSIASSNGSVMICWTCLGDFYANNFPKIERV